jgi:formylglycine-generating enzyme required for sulfatase activity
MRKRFCLLTAFIISFTALKAQSDTAFTTIYQTIPETGLKFKLVPIPAGKFNMGSSPQDQKAEKDETPVRNVSVSAFWMGAYEVTYEEYDIFMQDNSVTQNSEVDAITRPSQPYIDLTLGMGKTAGYPANSMQQYGALMYCRWLYKKTGIFYRLPTEAEWEYACRAGSTSVYPFGNDAAVLKEYAWFQDNSNDHYNKVGLLKPNKWGLYDMLGNVTEWTLDQYDPSAYSSTGTEVNDPVLLPRSRHPRTVRGGSFKDPASELRVANRLRSDPVWNRRDPQIPKSRWWNADAPFVGFRVVRPFIQPADEEIESFFKQYLDQ